MLDKLIEEQKKDIKWTQNAIKVSKELGRIKPKMSIFYDRLQKDKDLLQCLEYLKLFITNAQVIKTDKEQIVEVVSTIKDQKVLVDLIRFIIKEAV